MTANLAQKIAEARKAIINVTGLAASLLTLGLVPEPEAGWIATGIAVLAAVAHYSVPNAPQLKPPVHEAAPAVPVAPTAPVAAPVDPTPPTVPPAAPEGT